MRLVYRFGIAFLVVVLVVGAVLTVTFDAHRTDVDENTDASLADRASLSASVLDDRIRAQQRTVQVAAANPDLTAHGTERQDRALENFVASTAFDGASLVNETGRVQSFETTTPGFDADTVVGLDFGDRAYVQRALAGEQHVSDPFRARTGNTVVVISAPLTVDGEIVGTVNGAYQLGEPGLFDSLVSDDERDAITVQAGNATLYTTADRFDDTVAHGVALETVDWTVTAHRDQAAVDEQTHRLVLFQAVSGVALLGAVTAFGGWVYRSKIRRIGRLVDRVRALERRQYDAGPSLTGATEWRRIDDALERLAATLARREQMLLVLNRILRHNLRNSLNVVVGRASELENRLDGDDQESAREIRTVTGELLELADRARMTEELLDPVGETSPRTDLAAVVRDRVGPFTRALGADDDGAAPDVTVTTPDRAVAACGSEVAVALDELFANVADHAGPAPTVAVTVERADDCVRIRIADDGPGIPDDEAAVITGSRAISQVTHTGGIGLWLVDWIVSRYDGRLLIPPAGAGPSAGNGAVDDSDPAFETEGGTDRESETDGVPDTGGATVVLEFPSPAESGGEADSADADASFDG